ncbi:hypothetical protein E1B28_012242, partial [Marasmius oreades]
MNIARETRKGNKEKPARQEGGTNNPTAPPTAVNPLPISATSTAPTIKTTPTHAAPPVSGTSGEQRAMSTMKPRAVSARNIYAEKFKDEILAEAAAGAQGKGGGGFLGPYQKAITERMRKLSDKEMAELEEAAKEYNDGRAVKPPMDVILQNQEQLELAVATALQQMIGDDWGQYGDVSFVVHTIKPVAYGEPEVRMLSVTRTKAEGFKIADDDFRKFEDSFLKPLKKWHKSQTKGKGKDTRDEAHVEDFTMERSDTPPGPDAAPNNEGTANNEDGEHADHRGVLTTELIENCTSQQAGTLLPDESIFDPPATPAVSMNDVWPASPEATEYVPDVHAVENDLPEGMEVTSSVGVSHSATSESDVLPAETVSQGQGVTGEGSTLHEQEGDNEEEEEIALNIPTKASTKRRKGSQGGRKAATKKIKTSSVTSRKKR